MTKVLRWKSSYTCFSRFINSPALPSRHMSPSASSKPLVYHWLFLGPNTSRTSNIKLNFKCRSSLTKDKWREYWLNYCVLQVKEDRVLDEKRESHLLKTLIKYFKKVCDAPYKIHKLHRKKKSLVHMACRWSPNTAHELCSNMSKCNTKININFDHNNI